MIGEEQILYGSKNGLWVSVALTSCQSFCTVDMGETGSGKSGKIFAGKGKGSAG
jgi:hypothetical protein